MSADDTAPSGEGDLGRPIRDTLKATNKRAWHVFGSAALGVDYEVALLPVVNAHIAAEVRRALLNAADELARFGETADGAEALREMVAKMEAADD